MLPKQRCSVLWALYTGTITEISSILHLFAAAKRLLHAAICYALILPVWEKLRKILLLLAVILFLHAKVD